MAEPGPGSGAGPGAGVGPPTAPLDPDAARLIERFAADGVLPYDRLGVLRARTVLDGVTRLQGERLALPRVEDLLVPGAAGLIPVRVYRPQPPGGGQQAGLVVYLHGGGWALGGVAVADRPCRSLAARSGCAVVSVEYRRAPETPFPGPLDDCLAAWDWACSHAAQLGADPGRVAIVGDSAGGNLAAAVALAARRPPGSGVGDGHTPPALQVLVYPVLTPRPQPSHLSLAEGYLMTTAELQWFWRLYLGADPTGALPEPPELAAPLHAADLTGLAPAVVVTAGYDPLRDEGLAYVDRLRHTGVAVESLHHPGSIHGAMWMAAALGAGRAMLDQVGDAIGRHLVRV